MNRAYSILNIKAVDAEERVIEGVASTPTPDRVGDVVEPMGAKFKLPMPLLWQHRHDSPIGHVEFAEPTEDGIPFRARLAKIADAGPLKDDVDKAWQAIKSGLVRGVSIGFRAMENGYEVMKNGGYRFKQWEWLELSAVTIPANAEATIVAIKAIDSVLRAASGQKQQASPGASGRPVVKLNRKPEGANVNYAERIKELEASLAAKVEQRNAIQQKAADEGRTKDESERESFDTLGEEIKSLRQEIDDYRELEKENVAKAAPVNGKTQERAAESRGATAHVQVKAPHAEPGIRFARAIKAMGVAHKKHRDVETVAREMYPDDVLVHKAVAAGTTLDSDAHGALVGDESSVFADFVEYLRPQTILGKFGSNGIPALRRVPFRTRLVTQATGGQGYWVGEGKPKPLTEWTTSSTTLEPLKVANIAVITDELLRDSSPSAEQMVRNELAAALRERLDTDFIDPDKFVAPNVSPASITNGVTPIASAGVDAEAVRADIKAAMESFIAANNAPTTGVWVVPSTTALGLSLMLNPLGQPEFPGITMNGGTLFGLPVITSEYVPVASDGAYVVLVNASDIYFADDGGIAIDASREASLEMLSSALQQDATAGTGASLVSLWQTNSVGFRAERTLNWAKRRASAVAVIGAVNWGETVS